MDARWYVGWALCLPVSLDLWFVSLQGTSAKCQPKGTVRACCVSGSLMSQSPTRSTLGGGRRDDEWQQEIEQHENERDQQCTSQPG